MKDYLMGEHLEPWKSGTAQTITLVITQDCNLRCKYCYMVDKNNNNVMSFATGERAIDYFLENKDMFIAEAVILEFIGGEPLLEIELMDHLTDYFKRKAYNLNHPWFVMYRISISTNGLLYASPKVQKYIKKNHSKLSIGITLDGTKEKNDLQRVYADGRGSYDDIIKNIKLWQEQFPGATTKVTVGHDDLSYLKDSVIHLWELGLKVVPANVVFENIWQDGDDDIFYSQLRELADYIIDHDKWQEYNTTLFTRGIGYPLDEEELNKNSCGSGAMIAVDAKGDLFPCVRFMDYALDHKKGYRTGNIYDGINTDKVRAFYVLDCKSQSDAECLTCEVASGCQWCTGYNYDQSKIGTVFERSKSICKMHKARIRANNYLWSRLSREKGIIPYKDRGSQKYLFIMLADNSVSFCNYHAAAKENEIMSDDYLEKAAAFCHSNFYTAVLLHSNRVDLTSKAQQIFQGVPSINIYPFDNTHVVHSYRDIMYHDSRSILQETKSNTCCVLKVEQKELNQLSTLAAKALVYFSRVNLNLIYNPQTLDIDLYKEQLGKIADIVLEYFKSGTSRQINLITDEIYYKKRNNCNFGFNNLALAPDGLLYTCPAIYFETSGNIIGSIHSGIDRNYEIKRKFFNPDSNAVCAQCDIKHCNWCSCWNKKLTEEYHVPSAKQCHISQIEKMISYYLYELLKQNNLITPQMSIIEQINESDPILTQKTFSASILNFSYIQSQEVKLERETLSTS